MNVKQTVKVILALLVGEGVLTKEQALHAHRTGNAKLSFLDLNRFSLEELIDLLVADEAE